MTRTASGDRIEVPPTNNIYTVLAVIAVLVNLIAFVLIFLRWTAVFGEKSNLFQL
ncbi:MAG: hypothetical protein M3O30_10595 [Planctomycetota bacterium]|nr:hypothetical protein [Planctomycetota bacterium]